MVNGEAYVREEKPQSQHLDAPDEQKKIEQNQSNAGHLTNVSFGIHRLHLLSANI